MKPVFKADLRGIDGMQRNIRAVREGFPVWMAAANRDTADLIRENAQRNIRTLDAYATGDMYKGVQVTFSRAGLVFAVGSEAEYAPYVEFGTRPHFPPLDAIREWCVVRGIPVSAAYPIARAIARRGLPERPFLYPAMLSAMRSHAERVRAKVAAGLRGLLA